MCAGEAEGASSSSSFTLLLGKKFAANDSGNFFTSYWPPREREKDEEMGAKQTERGELLLAGPEAAVSILH